MGPILQGYFSHFLVELSSTLKDLTESKLIVTLSDRERWDFVLTQPTMQCLHVPGCTACQHLTLNSQ